MQSLKLFPALINVPQLKFESKLMLQAHSRLVEKTKKEGAVTNLLGLGHSRLVGILESVGGFHVLGLGTINN
jgi:hypothetical protein